MRFIRISNTVSEIREITGSQFATEFCLKDRQLAWFLGAGASASAGIPTGYDMIIDFKKKLFCQLSSIKPREVDANDPVWLERINYYLSKHSSLPPSNDPLEYAAAFEKIYPTPDLRRIYIENAIRKGSPSFGHKVLASLITTKKIPCLFTTNFDSLIESTATVTDQMVDASLRAHLTVAAIDNADRAVHCMRESRWPLLAKLHGDFQSIQLKNTNEELQTQDSKMRTILTSCCSRFGFIIVGYSGRDKSIMDTLTEAISQPNPFPGGIYWVARSEKNLLPAVKAFFNTAIDAGINVTLIKSQTFDELNADIAEQIDFPEKLNDYIYQSKTKINTSHNFRIYEENRSFPVLQCSTIPILSLPKFARHIKIDKPLTTIQARELIKEAKVRAIVTSNGLEIAAFGADKELERAFKDVNGKLLGRIELDAAKDSWALGLIYDALTRAMCRNQPLFARMRRSGHLILVKSSEIKGGEHNTLKLSQLKAAYSAPLFGSISKCNINYNEGVQIKLENFLDKWWCCFEPTTFVADQIGDDKQIRSIITDWRRELWAKRYNSKWAKIITAWANILSGDNGGRLETFNINSDEGQDAVFQISSITAWSRPSHDHHYFHRGEKQYGL